MAPTVGARAGGVHRGADPWWRSRTALWLVLAAVTSAALVVLYPDSYQEDGGTHFLGAHWAWRPGHHSMLVDVWGRPLFTVLYSLPAQFGYRAAKLMTVVVCLAAAWHTSRLAERLGVERAHLAVPLLFLQPSFLLLSAETMTEPLFALVLVVALRLHLAGRVRAGMLLASLLPLVRPEGFFLCVLWGVWILIDRRGPGPWWRRLPSTLWLATGCVLWWLAALVITGDPLFIRHNWPPNWAGNDALYGRGSFWAYARLGREIVGPLLQVPFALGLLLLLARRRLMEVTSPVVLLFLVHSSMWAYGLMNSAGYPRYFVCVATPIAIITLVGWNAAVGVLKRRLPNAVVHALAAVVLLVSLHRALAYVDAMPWSRDTRAQAEMRDWFRAHPRPVRRLVWTKANVAILLDWDPWDRPPLTGGKDEKLATLRASPAGTLAFWDDDAGPAHFGLAAADFEAAGFTLLRAVSYRLERRIPGPPWHSSRPESWLRGEEPRVQRLYLLYKVGEGS